jgi:large subunit ribosomal protein L6
MEAQTTNEPVRTSRVGKRPVDVPKGVTVTLNNGVVEVKGPKGTLARPVPADVIIKIEAGKATVTSSARGSDAARLQGMVRAHINNMVKGASEGYTKTLELVGTGYRAEVKGNVLHMALGLSHPVIFPLPGDIKATIPGDSKGTIVILTGSDKDLMGQTAAKLRSFRPPEPYGGKGVRYKGENVRRKAGKAGGKGGKAGSKGGK